MHILCRTYVCGMCQFPNFSLTNPRILSLFCNVRLCDSVLLLFLKEVVYLYDILTTRLTEGLVVCLSFLDPALQ